MRTNLLVLTAAASLVTPRISDAASCIPGFDYAIFAAESIQIQGNASTDSYDSTSGTYAQTKTCSDGDIGTNATSGGAVVIQSASTKICGDVVVGAGGNPNSVVQQHNNATVTGTKSAQTTNTPLPVATFPTLPNAANMNPSSQNSAAVLAPGFRYQNVTCQNGSLTLSAGQYVLDQLQLQANCQLIVASGPIEVYFHSQLQLQGGAVANASGKAGNLIFYGGANASNVQVQGGSSAAFAVYAPKTQCQAQGNADIYGAIVCKNAQVQGNGHIHYDKSLQAISGGGFACAAVEVSRSSPIVATIGNDTAIVQGTYDFAVGTPKTINAVADVATFAFPFIKGHMRARVASTISTTASTYSSGTILFDAGATGKIPAASNAGCNSFDGTCRNLFTVTQQPDAQGVSLRPSRVQFKDGNASTIGALIAPASAVPGINASHWTSIVQKVLAGKLGGVDRSTVAVVGPSVVAGVSTRPSIVYFGATDGMIHAVCASTGGTTPSDSNICPSLGTEIWAFMPRVQLPLVRKNVQRIDGSMRVIDAFGDFDGSGTKEFRTILLFQTGYADVALGGAAVYALDVTDPANPSVVWEHTKQSAAATYQLGTGLTLAAGPTLVNGKPRYLAIAQTTNAGTGGTGVVATAIDLETGARVWQFGYAYPSPPRGVTADLPLPVTGIPGGAVGVDLTRQGFTTDIVMGDLYGNLWRLDAATGASKTGATTPLFQFSTNKKPIGAMPAVYSNGNQQFAVFASGGYVDPVAAAWTAGTQALVAVRIDSTGTFPINDTQTTRLAIKQNLTGSNRAVAQVLVVGKELFLTTDTTDVNAASFGVGTTNTGSVTKYDLAGNAATIATVRAGAGSLANIGTDLYSSTASRQQELAQSAASTAGETVDTASVSKMARKLWLRLE